MSACPSFLSATINTAILDSNLPLFYRELSYYFQELRKFSEYDKNNDLILSNNRRITIERNSVFWKQWFYQGVTFISDLMNSNGKFLTFEEFQNKFEIKANYLHYFQLIAAIPPDLKRKAFGSTVPDLLGVTTDHCQTEDRTIVLTKFRCKIYYSLSIEKLVSEPSAVRAWKKAFQNFLIGVPCKQWFLQAGRYATKGEKPLRASVCFSDRAAVQRYGRIN